MQSALIESGSRTVAVLGAGPVGLAAAAHLLEQGLEPRVFEAGAGPGGTFRDVAHVRLFSPWRWNIDAAAQRLLKACNWSTPDPDGLPTGGELVTRYLEPLAAVPALRGRIRYHSPVVAIARDGLDKMKTPERSARPFVLRVREGSGETRDYHASAVIDTTGTWKQPNPLGPNGLPAAGEAQLQGRIDYGMPDVLGRDRDDYANAGVLVVGAGHSAAGTLLALVELAQEAPETHIHWAVRGATPERLLGSSSAEDALPARGALGEVLRSQLAAGRVTLHTHFPIGALQQRNGRLRVVAAGSGPASSIDGIDRIVAATGARPDLELVRELRVEADPMLESVPALAALVDPNHHSCGTVPPHGHRELAHPEPGFYIAGAKSYGRAPTFLMATGYEQVRSIAAALSGDTQRADVVELELPETGICGVPSADRDGRGRKDATACCPTGVSR